ncbi:uncharacterized protein METZ01_LOCUS98657, partial [marine metagenome]
MKKGCVLSARWLKHGISTVALWRYATDHSFTAYTITSDANLAGGVF